MTTTLWIAPMMHVRGGVDGDDNDDTYTSHPRTTHGVDSDEVDIDDDITQCVASVRDDDTPIATTTIDTHVVMSVCRCQGQDHHWWSTDDVCVPL